MGGVLDRRDVLDLMHGGSRMTIDPDRGGILIRGTIVNTTCGKHKNLYIYLFIPIISGPIYYAPP